MLNAIKKLVFGGYIYSLYGLISTADDGGSTGIIFKLYYFVIF